MANKIYLLVNALVADLEDLQYEISPETVLEGRFPKKRTQFYNNFKKLTLFLLKIIETIFPFLRKNWFVGDTIRELINAWIKGVIYFRNWFLDRPPQPVVIPKDPIVQNLETTLLKNLKSSVLTFGKERLFTGKADLADYALLIEELKKVTKQQHLVIPTLCATLEKKLAKHKAMLDIQTDLPRTKQFNQPETPIPQPKSGGFWNNLFPRLQVDVTSPTYVKTSKWKHIKAAVKFGLINHYLPTVANKMTERKLPFQAIPPIPSDRRAINLYGFANLINKVDPSLRNAAKWIWNHVRVITFRELLHSLKDASAEFSQMSEFTNGYTILTRPNKSQSWVTNLALRFVPVALLPTRINNVWAKMFSDTHEIATIIANSKPKNFVRYDDIIYTGKKLRFFLEQFQRAAVPYYPFFKPNQPINLCLMVGFMSEGAKKVIEKQIARMKKSNIHVTLICKHTFKSIAEQVHTEKLHAEKARIQKNSQEKVLNEKAIYYPELDSNFEKDIFTLINNTYRNKKSDLRATVTTEWKTANYDAVPEMLHTGYTPYQTHLFEGLFSSLPLTQKERRPLKQVEAPYKKYAAF